jgi:triacylglycerol lipase
VDVVDFRDRHCSNHDHAAEIIAAIGRLRAATGFECTDVVAHSMGGLALRLCLADAGHAACIRRVVFLATPHAGTWAAWLARGAGGREMRPGSALMRELGQSSVADHVRGWTIRTPIDLRIFPGGSADLDGMRGVEVCCPTHRGLLRSARVFAAIARALTEADPEV